MAMGGTSRSYGRKMGDTYLEHAEEGRLEGMQARHIVGRCGIYYYVYQDTPAQRYLRKYQTEKQQVSAHDAWACELD